MSVVTMVVALFYGAKLQLILFLLSNKLFKNSNFKKYMFNKKSVIGFLFLKIRGCNVHKIYVVIYHPPWELQQYHW